MPAPLDDLEKALRLDTDFYDARLLRGQIILSQGRYREAIDDFKRCLLLVGVGSRPWSRLQISIASTYLRRLQPQEALKHLDTASDPGTNEAEIASLRARALYLSGDHAEALECAQRVNEPSSVYFPAVYLPSQILAAMGATDEAINNLRKLSSKYKKGVEGLNLAEAYLAVDPTQTRKLLKRRILP